MLDPMLRLRIYLEDYYLLFLRVARMTNVIILGQQLGWHPCCYYLAVGL